MMFKKLMCYAAFVGLVGCTTSVKQPDDSTSIYQDYIVSAKLKAEDKISAFKFYGWNELDDKHLIIKTSPQKPYLITLKQSCHNLRFTQNIGVDNHGSTLSARFDSIVVPDFPEQRCFIDKIHPLSKEQAKELATLGKSK